MSLIVGVAGGSGSGKTTFARTLLEIMGSEKSALIAQDSYYFDQSHRFKGDGSVNFDHPDALDWEYLKEHLAELRKGKSVQVPIYDFSTHTRLSETQRLEAKPLIVLDGILILTQEKIRNLIDISVYVHTDEPIRYQRRLERDVKERGRTAEGVKAQYDKFVRPMHDKFVAPSREFANIEVSGEEGFGQPLQDLVFRIEQHLKSAAF